MCIVSGGRDGSGRRPELMRCTGRLQNNLDEYYQMISWVRRDFLGTASEFANDFTRPIQEGACQLLP